VQYSVIAEDGKNNIEDCLLYGSDLFRIVG